jgi:hypothetical protein
MFLSFRRNKITTHSVSEGLCDNRMDQATWGICPQFHTSLKSEKCLSNTHDRVWHAFDSPDLYQRIEDSICSLQNFVFFLSLLIFCLQIWVIVFILSYLQFGWLCLDSVVYNLGDFVYTQLSTISSSKPKYGECN